MQDIKANFNIVEKKRYILPIIFLSEIQITNAIKFNLACKSAPQTNVSPIMAPT